MRKTILAVVLAALAVPALSQQSEAAGFRNNAGGMTIITTRNQYCGDHGMSDGYAFAATGHSVRMCWISKAGMILAQYEDGTVYKYPPEVFEMLDEEPEVNFNKP